MSGLEKVARALATAAKEDPNAHVGKLLPEDRKIWMDYVDDARLAVEAIREPSQGARMAGHAALVTSNACEGDLGSAIGYAALGDAWRAMIDEILAEKIEKN